MAEAIDKESRTEEPTEKRVHEAVEKGNVPFSREVVTFGALASLAAVFKLFAPWSFGKLAVTLRGLLGNSGLVYLDDREAVARFLMTAGLAIAIAILPVLFLLAAGSVLSSLVQNAPSIATERVTPRASRISPAAGWNRIFGRSGLVEFAKAVVKLAAVGAVTLHIVRSHIGDIEASMEIDPGNLPHTILGLLLDIVIALCVLSLLLAIADTVWSRFKWRADLRMSRQEIKDEMKQAEGDPHIKARVRSVARQMASRRMFVNLPQATMVIANPTHYAVALRYAREEAGAPVVVAKGVDFLALRIREIAATYEIPVIENKPLARGLYDTVEVDAQIPPEFYRAVAEIIHFLHRRRRIPLPMNPG